MTDRSCLRLIAVLAVPICLAAGCAKPDPHYFPPAPLRSQRHADGGIDRLYDADHDGRADCFEHIAPDGIVRLLAYDDDGDGQFAQRVDRRSPTDAEPGRDRQLLIVVDSIPFDMIHDLWLQGRFRLFHPPSRVISPFPVMTDPCLATFFGTLPCPGVESHYYDGKQLTDPFYVYLREANAPWLSRVDFHLPPITHLLAYAEPHPWFDREMARIRERFLQQGEGNYAAYVVSTSALGANDGRNGHLAGLVRLDRFCQSLMHRMRGRLQITLLSDHGHNLVPSRLLSVSQMLERCGYRLSHQLEAPGDVIVPEYGVVTCAAVYTRSPAAVAGDITGVEGIDLAMYLREDGDVVVVSRTGRARVTRAGDKYRYLPEVGDPLDLLPIWQQLQAAGAVDADGFVEDRTLFAATQAHRYPDAVHRVWRAFHGMFVHTPDVFIAVEDGWHCGRKVVSKYLDLAAAHGNLYWKSSCGFAMTTAGDLPPVLRMQDLPDALRELGIHPSGHKADSSPK